MGKKTILLVDGNPLCWRSSDIFKKFSTKAGKKTGVIFGALRNLESALRKYKPDSYAIVFDEGKSRWRKEALPSYKISRVQNKRDDFDYTAFYEEMDEFKALLPLMGVKVIRAQGVEADDILGLLVDLIGLSTKEPTRTVIVGGDRDLWQLIDENVVCYDPVRKSEMDLDKFVDKYKGLLPPDLIEVKALTGDSGDDIPGVKGIGEATAIKALNQFGELKDLFQETNREELDKNFRTRDLLDKKETVDRAKLLVTILRFANVREMNERHSVLNQKELDTLCSCINSESKVDRLKLVASLAAYELDSISDRLNDFLSTITPKVDFLEGTSDLFRSHIGDISEGLSKEEELDKNWESLDSKILSCSVCLLSEECKNPVLAQGYLDSPIMIVGRNPGRSEDVEGIPFVGPSGKRLDHLLKACGIDRAEQCFVTNCCRCYSTDNRAPTEEELKACAHFLREEIDLLKPKLILSFGNEAMALLTSESGITKNNGTVLYNPTGRIGKVNCPVVLMVHPSYVIRNPTNGNELFRRGEAAIRKVLSELGFAERGGG